MTEQQNDPTASPRVETTADRTGKSGSISPSILGGAALALSIIALGVAAVPYISGGFNNQVRHYLISNPQILDEMLEARKANEEEAVVSTINAAVKANPALLAVDARDPSFGPADAKVTVIEYFDFRCPGCKAVAPAYRALMAAHPEVRFVFKDWPILDQGETVTSQYAARAALAAHQQGKYLEVYDDLMDGRSLDLPTIDAILVANGVDMAKAKAAIASDEMTRHVTDIHTSAAAMGLRGTPTFFVNGKAAPNIDPAHVGQMIEEAKGA